MNSKPSEIDLADYPGMLQLKAVFNERYRMSRDIVDRGIKTFGRQWAEECEETLQRVCHSSENLAHVAKGYSSFAVDSIRRQMQFEKDHKYPEKSYSDVAQDVYFNQEFMMSEYLPGLLLSHYLWPHHYRQRMFFEMAFMEPMRINNARSFVEVGVGTGLYSRLLLQHLPDIRGVGFDISPASKLFTERHIDAFGFSGRYDVLLQDVVASAVEPVSWLVCVEVLEHLEDPLSFLRTLHQMLLPGGRAFITAALNAAHADHIYLYETAEDVLEQLKSAGFSLEQSFVGAAYKPANSDLPVPLAAAFVVY